MKNRSGEKIKLASSDELATAATSAASPGSVPHPTGTASPEDAGAAFSSGREERSALAGSVLLRGFCAHASASTSGLVPIPSNNAFMLHPLKKHPTMYFSRVTWVTWVTALKSLNKTCYPFYFHLGNKGNRLSPPAPFVTLVTLLFFVWVTAFLHIFQTRYPCYPCYPQKEQCRVIFRCPGEA